MKKLFLLLSICSNLLIAKKDPASAETIWLASLEEGIQKRCQNLLIAEKVFRSKFGNGFELPKVDHFDYTEGRQ